MTGYVESAGAPGRAAGAAANKDESPGGRSARSAGVAWLEVGGRGWPRGQGTQTGRQGAGASPGRSHAARHAAAQEAGGIRPDVDASEHAAGEAAHLAMTAAQIGAGSTD